jgi:hypothetical protein
MYKCPTDYKQESRINHEIVNFILNIPQGKLFSHINYKYYAFSV